MTPKLRQGLYVVGTIASAILTILSALHILNPEAVTSLSGALTTILGLFGVTAAGTAAVVTGQQRRDGTFNTPSPADQVISGLDAVLAQATAAKADVDRVKEAVNAVAKNVPVLGPLATQALNTIIP